MDTPLGPLATELDLLTAGLLPGGPLQIEPIGRDGLHAAKATVLLHGKPVAEIVAVSRPLAVIPRHDYLPWGENVELPGCTVYTLRNTRNGQGEAGAVVGHHLPTLLQYAATHWGWRTLQAAAPTT
jgi:antitoxin (DNA-binding transcriptional repressor) of toxin-antitoxin stability system